MFKSREWISGKDTHINLYHTHSHTHIHILDHHLICTGTRGISTAWLQLFHSRSGYPATTVPKAFTKGTTLRQTNTLSPPQLPALLLVTGSTQGILSPKPTHLLKLLDDTHLAEEAHQLVAVKLKPAHRKWEKVLWQLFHSAISKTYSIQYNCVSISMFFGYWPRCFHSTVSKTVKKLALNVCFMSYFWVLVRLLDDI